MFSHVILCHLENFMSFANLNSTKSVFDEVCIRRTLIRRNLIRRNLIRRSLIRRSLIRRSLIRRNLIRRNGRDPLSQCNFSA